MTRTTYLPDPLLTANIYCGGLLDDLVARALLPFWQALRQASLDLRCYLWIVRYSRRGEHLKVRLHGDAADHEAFQQLLTEHVEVYLKTVQGASAKPRTIRSDVPPIDPEDEPPDDAPDNTLLWTTYRRSHVSLGGSPWIDDDIYLAHATRCLARGCELVLKAMGSGTAWVPGRRQKLLLKALLPGLGALGLGAPRRAAEYLRYHRDWLLRFFLDEGKERTVLEHFDQQARHTTVVRQLQQVALWQWAAQAAEVTNRELWPQALSDLSGYIGSFRDREDYQVDPFTSEVTYPPIFKILHGLANQIGLPPLEEAYVHHLLLAAMEAATAPSRRGSAT